MIENEPLINEYTSARGLSEKRIQTVKSILNHYSRFQNATLPQLINEADIEEEQGIRWKRRTLKKRLINYMNHLKLIMLYSSANAYFSVVKTFYRHNEIEIGYLPSFNVNMNFNLSDPITYKDLPDKEIIRKAVEISNPLFKAIILLLSSTGMAKVDLRQLTIKDWLNATERYHHTDNLSEALKIMLNADVDIIPIWRLRRKKTNKYFVTFNTHETSIAIINYLQSVIDKKELHNSDRLLPVSETYFTIKFEEINDSLGLGKAGTYNRFRGHMLRKFHASNLKKAGMSRDEINVLQGKSNGRVDDVYFFEDENKLYNDYLKYMHSLLIYTDVNVVTVDDDDVILIKKENDELRKQMNELINLKREVMSLKEWFKD